MMKNIHIYNFGLQRKKMEKRFYWPAVLVLQREDYITHVFTARAMVSFGFLRGFIRFEK